MFSPRSKTWTFPNLKTPAGPAEVYLAVEEEEEEAVSFGSPFRGVGILWFYCYSIAPFIVFKRSCEDCFVAQKELLMYSGIMDVFH